MSEDPTLKAKLETIKRKQKYKELIEKGSEISKYSKNFSEKEISNCLRIGFNRVSITFA